MTTITACGSSFAYLGRRAAAYVVDCLLLLASLLVWQALLYGANPIMGLIRTGQQPTGAQLHLWVFATASVPFWLYFAWTQSSARQATFGMRVFKLKVIDIHGDRIGVRQALLRSAVMLIPFELNHAVLFHLMPRVGVPTQAFWVGYAGVWVVMAVYVAVMLITPRWQSMHDLLARTVVTDRDR